MPTEAKDIFEATSRSLRELMTENGLGLYIPPYQRPYGWDKRKVEKLLDDTLHGLAMLTKTEDSFTFLGTIITIHDINYTTVQPIVRDQVPAKVLTVIDGQQRLCSLTLLTVCLHNQIRLRMNRLFRGEAPAEPALTWIHGQSLELLKHLGGTFYERQSYGDAPIYPRMIRAFTDQWSRLSEHAHYESPIAHLINTYAAIAEKEYTDKIKVTEFRPEARDGIGEGEADLVKRYGEIRSVLRDLAKAKRIEDLQDAPTLTEIASSKSFQRALLNHEFPDAVLMMMKEPPSDIFAELFRLVILGAYVLNRIALTVVKGKNEDYAFTIFESLNTTGEPLTAFETFMPRVVSAEGLEGYETSKARKCMDNIADYLSGFHVGDQLQGATRELLVTFALAETGEKLSKRLADQRAYLKDEFERHENDMAERVRFVRHLRDAAAFTEHTWLSRDRTPTPHLDGLPIDATTDAVRLCSAFFRDLNHSVIIAPLVRFYAVALNSPVPEQPEKVKEFEQAIRAMTAFSVLWRTSRRTTGNIDREYRDIMGGINSLTKFGPLARTRRRGVNEGPMPIVDVTGLKAELRARLADPEHGGIAGQDEWLEQSRPLPIYQINRPLTRFVLLAAYHDTVVDTVNPGLIMKGKEGSAPCLTYDGWCDEIHLSLEHVAPQGGASAWPDELYKDKETIHKLGNMVLLPQDINSSVSSRPWVEKRILYGALGATSKEEARAILEEAAEHGVKFPISTEKLVDLSKYMAQLTALSERTEPWDLGFIEIRSRTLLELAWGRLRPWLD